MIRGFDASRRGMAVEQTRSDVISNNVANVNTDGFKRSVAVSKPFGDMVQERLGDFAPGEQPAQVGPLGNGAVVDAVAVEKKDGELRFTDNPLDVALIGPGQFVYQGPNGTVGYTRNGAFTRDTNGRLTTADGNPILVGGQPVGTLADKLEIAADGTVLLDGKAAGKLDIQGANGTTVLKTKTLESSTTDLAAEMTDLTIAMRSYQVNQRALVMQDNTLARAVSDIGKV